AEIRAIDNGRERGGAIPVGDVRSIGAGPGSIAAAEVRSIDNRGKCGGTISIGASGAIADSAVATDPGNPPAAADLSDGEIRVPCGSPTNRMTEGWTVIGNFGEVRARRVVTVRFRLSTAQLGPIPAAAKDWLPAAVVRT